MDPNFFARMKTRWEHVVPLIGPDGSIPTEEFLAAASELVAIFDLLQSVAFQPVKADMERNISNVRERFVKDKAKNATLQKLVLEERKELGAKALATRSLMWYKRGMEFLYATFQRSLNNEKEELSKSFSEAYSVTLSKHHNFMMRPIFHVAVKACPYRADFYASLGKDRDQLLADMRAYFDSYGQVTKVLVDFYNAEKLEDKP